MTGSEFNLDGGLLAGTAAFQTSPQSKFSLAFKRDRGLPTVPLDPRGDERLYHVLNASERLVSASSVDEVVAVLRDTARAAVGAEGVAVVIENHGLCSYVAEDAAHDCCTSAYQVFAGRSMG